MDFSKHKERYSFKMNGIPMGKISSYTVSKQMDTDVEPGEEYDFFYEVTLRRRCDQRSESEAINLFAVETFEIEIERLGYRTIYKECGIYSVYEELDQADSPIYQTITVRCPERIRLPL